MHETKANEQVESYKKNIDINASVQIYMTHNLDEIYGVNQNKMVKSYNENTDINEPVQTHSTYNSTELHETVLNELFKENIDEFSFMEDDTMFDYNHSQIEYYEYLDEISVTTLTNQEMEMEIETNNFQLFFEVSP